LKTFAIVTLGIALPLTVTSIGLDAETIAIGAGATTLVAAACLMWSFEPIRAAIRRLTGRITGSLTQALIASSLTLACGIGAALTWSGGPLPKLAFVVGALLFVNWWLHVLVKTGVSRLVRENRALRQAVASLESQVAELAPAGEENERVLGVVRHVMNVLLGLEAAKDGRTGVNELGPSVWIERLCLRTTRDVLERLGGGPEDYRIELGVLRMHNEVLYVDMAAGELLRRYQEEGGCPVPGTPRALSVSEILELKAKQGGFVDSAAVEFQLNEEPHYMVAFSGAPLDDLDRELLALIASMFIVLKLALDE
jgi:hypothetical protein